MSDGSLGVHVGDTLRLQRGAHLAKESRQLFQSVRDMPQPIADGSEFAGHQAVDGAARQLGVDQGVPGEFLQFAELPELRLQRMT